MGYILWARAGAALMLAPSICQGGVGSAPVVPREQNLSGSMVAHATQDFYLTPATDAANVIRVYADSVVCAMVPATAMHYTLDWTPHPDGNGTPNGSITMGHPVIATILHAVIMWDDGSDAHTGGSATPLAGHRLIARMDYRGRASGDITCHTYLIETPTDPNYSDREASTTITIHADGLDTDSVDIGGDTSVMLDTLDLNTRNISNRVMITITDNGARFGSLSLRVGEIQGAPACQAGLGTTWIYGGNTYNSPALDIDRTTMGWNGTGQYYETTGLALGVQLNSLSCSGDYTIPVHVNVTYG